MTTEKFENTSISTSSKNQTMPVSLPAEELPSSLRHKSSKDALVEAKYLTVFLCRATNTMLDTQDYDGNLLMEPEAYASRAGLELCFKLLQDKLDIALGSLQFPTQQK